MRIAVIDDEKPARRELSYLIQDAEKDAVITEISSGEEALKVLSKETFDILCIDINLGDINGAALATVAHKLLPEAEIVFATAYDNYAEQAFEVDALYYLLKPFSGAKVKQMLDKYYKKQQNASTKDLPSLDRISINTDRKILLVDIDSIVYIEAHNRYCIIHTKSGDYQSSSSLNSFEEKLMGKGFFRIQKSFLIHTKYVLEIYPWFNNTYCVKMEGFESDILPVSRNQIKKLKQLYCI
jgi:two-component system response regulator LytT